MSTPSPGLNSEHSRLHIVTSQKIELFIATDVRTSNPTLQYLISGGMLIKAVISKY
jgi:hypothetical protein